MKRAAIGIRAHSGWGALIVVSGSAADVDVIERRRIAITDPKIEGSNQPYHFAQKYELPEAERYLTECAAVSERLAMQALGEIVQEVRLRGYVVVRGAILIASGRALPPLSKILDAHPLIHSAEGEFFRRAFWKACEQLGIHVTGIRERDLDGCADAAFGRAAARLRREIASAGGSLGPPWTTDQKTASLAALVVLANPRGQGGPHAAATTS